MFSHLQNIFLVVENIQFYSLIMVLEDKQADIMREPRTTAKIYTVRIQFLVILNLTSSVPVFLVYLVNYPVSWPWTVLNTPIHVGSVLWKQIEIFNYFKSIPKLTLLFSYNKNYHGDLEFTPDQSWKPEVNKRLKINKMLLMPQTLRHVWVAVYEQLSKQ